MLITMFKDIIDLPEQCIYGLVNKSDKKIFIGHTKDLVTALNRIGKDIKSSNHVLKEDINKLELIILEVIKDDSLLRSRYQFYYNQYSNMGYLHYRKYKAMGFYKLHVYVLNDVLDDNRCKARVYVSLHYGRSKEVVVGIFDSVPDSDVFINKYYVDKNNISVIIYSSNKLTKEYLSNGS